MINNSSFERYSKASNGAYLLKIGTDILPMLPIPLIMLIRRIPDMHSDSAALQRFLRNESGTVFWRSYRTKS